MDYENMTIEKLDAELLRLGKKRDAIRQEMLAITRIRDKKASLKEAERKVALMSDAEKAALLQVIQPKGIPSEEAFRG